MKRLDRICAFIGEFFANSLWALEQQWIVRWIIGGHWLFMNDEWISVEEVIMDGDGSRNRFFKFQDRDGLGGWHMFHESFNGIEEHEYH